MKQYITDLGRAGYTVKMQKGRVIIKSRQKTIIGQSENTLWTAQSILCAESYGFASASPYIAIDIGQNIGIASLYFAENENINHIYGFEPFAATFFQAQVNFANNPGLSGKITSFNYGLGQENKEIEAHYNKDLPGSMSTTRDRFTEGDLQQVAIRDASEVLKPILEKHEEKVLCKMDCEGAEKEILYSLEASGLLGRIDAIIMEWHFKAPDDLVSLLARNGFTVFFEHVVRNELGFIRGIVSRQATIAATPQGGGVRCLKAAEQAGNRVSGEAILTPERQARRDIIVADFSAADYLALYPDVRASGMDPLEHYLRFGRGEGRKPCRTRVDYSRLTPERLAGFHAVPAGDVVVCTSIAGGYEKLLPPAFLNDGWRYVCYADAPVESYGIWEIHPIPYEHADPTRKSRWAKLHLPELFSEARWILWLDANIVLNGDLSPRMASCDEKLPLYSVPHPCRTCLYDEALACISARKDEPGIIRRQVAAYAEQGMPAHGGLYENNFFLLNPRHPQARLLFSRWWDEYEKYSKRDQISLPYVLYANGMTPGRLFPEGNTARNHPALYFLTHEETGWVSAPEFVKRAPAS
ncbi:MAG: FkbM family methyltransferase [Deltaproteobacteria bacterium]|jgi:FkbM family methyltransferase|nr:FkbM family methyltransferase [Deltaproteobacteria bacterium]